jgi:hypothetical protein
MENLYEQAKVLAGREVVVAQTTDGKYVVEWLSFSHAPPPKADTEKEALEGFISMMFKIKERDNEDDTRGSDDTSSGELDKQD